MFGAAAENASTKFVVGDSVLLNGELNTNVYEKDGIKTYQTYVVTNKLVLCKYGKNNPKANQSFAPGNVQATPAQQFNMNYAGGDTESKRLLRGGIMMPFKKSIYVQKSRQKIHN